MIRIAAPLLLIACRPVAPAIGSGSGDDGSGGDGWDASIEADADTDADTDTDAEPVWDGDYAGTVEIVFDWPSWNWGDDCTGPADLSVSGDDVSVEMGCALEDAEVDAFMALSGSLSAGSGTSLLVLNDGERTDEADWSLSEGGGFLDGTVSGDMLAYGEVMNYTLEFRFEGP